jgi:hypothetical protein
MQGRYGNDRFNQVISIAALVCLVFSFFGWSPFFLLALAFMAYAYFRMFSRNIHGRARENQAYLKHERKVRGFFQKQKKALIQSRTHRIYQCPHCRQKIRVPRGKGKIEIRCQKCGATFQRKS